MLQRERERERETERKEMTPKFYKYNSLFIRTNYLKFLQISWTDPRDTTNPPPPKKIKIWFISNISWSCIDTCWFYFHSKICLLINLHSHILRLRGSAAACLLRLWVRIPPGAWPFVCSECCVFCQVEVSATSWSLVQRSSTDCGALLCVI